MSAPVRGPISLTSALDRPTASVAMPILWAVFLTLLVVGPWLAGGYIFGTDWPGPRRFGFPTDASSSAALRAALAVFSRIFSGEATSKVFIAGLLFLAAITSYRAIPKGGFIPRAAASTVFVINPFVYGRLHYGQLFLLAGYAALPWVGLRLRRLFVEPGFGTGFMAAASLALVGILSVHIFLISGVLAASIVASQLVSARNRPGYLKKAAGIVVLTAGVTAAASAYWIIPLLTGSGPEGSTLTGIGSGDLRTFAAVADQQLGLVPNLLGLYGFWAENSGRFASMKSYVPLWPAILGVLLAVAAVGAGTAIKQSKDRLAPWVASLLICAFIALVFEMGVSHPWTADLITWVDAHIPIYRGMRDAGKWAALLALVYSQLIGLGAAAIIEWLRTRVPDPTSREWTGGIAAGLVLALPLYYGNGLLFGMHGQIKPSRYPAGWYTADQVLVADKHPDLTLFLPWHEYMSFSFVENQNKVVGSPAPTFFSTPMLVSSNPEVAGVAPPTDPGQSAVANLVNAGATGDWAPVLAGLGVKYVLIAHELDWSSYNYLDGQSGLVKVGDYGSISLYRNTLL